MCTGTGTEVQKGTVPWLGRRPFQHKPVHTVHVYSRGVYCTKVAINYFLELVRVVLNISSSL